MRIPVLAALAMAFAATLVHAAEYSLRLALLTIPPKHLGDIPLVDRGKFVAALEADPARMDVANGWVHWFSDGHEVPCTSMVWMKELPRSGKSPLVFIHMAKPMADGRKPEANQTVVLEFTDEGWSDVTKAVIPPDVDRTMHFRTRRDGAVIEAAPWKEFERKDGRGKAWTYGERILDLEWTGEKLVAKEAASSELTRN